MFLEFFYTVNPQVTKLTLQDVLESLNPVPLSVRDS